MAPTRPAPITEYRELLLEAANTGVGHISSGVPSQDGVAEYSSDVGNGNKVMPMAVFESAPPREALELVDHFRATLWASSTTSNADVFVALHVIDGDREVSYCTYEPGSPFVPGEVFKIDVEIMPATGRVQRGNWLRIKNLAGGPCMSAGWEREYDASYHAGVINRILTGTSFPSSIAIPVVPRQDL
ncbi:hypothetical protein TrVGV298_001774 [Trichoderma virens]|nr:hypothetical protein TrVGV298_001774 [Trichoderma virens]